MGLLARCGFRLGDLHRVWRLGRSCGGLYKGINTTSCKIGMRKELSKVVGQVDSGYSFQVFGIPLILPEQGTGNRL